jgi:4'-phosphopantetheinyl transferase
MAASLTPLVVGPMLVASVTPPPQRAHAAGRALLADLLDILGVRSAIGAHCEVCGSDSHGRPVAESALLSVAYAPGRVVAAAALASAGRAIGVDIEVDRGADPMRELAALFAPHDPPDVRGWTVIEAVVKADGRGFRLPPHLVAATDEPGRILPASRRVRVPGRGTRIEAASVPALTHYVVSVAIDPGSEAVQ